MHYLFPLFIWPVNIRNVWTTVLYRPLEAESCSGHTNQQHYSPALQSPTRRRQLCRLVLFSSRLSIGAWLKTRAWPPSTEQWQEMSSFHRKKCWALSCWMTQMSWVGLRSFEIMWPIRGITHLFYNRCEFRTSHLGKMYVCALNNIHLQS